ncbi:MAG: hypothetical protein AAF648_12920 [Pseudomonadota bacterium]
MHYLAWVVAATELELRERLAPYNINSHQTESCDCAPAQRCDPVCYINPQGKWDGWTIGGRWLEVFPSPELSAAECLLGIRDGWPSTSERFPFSFVTESIWLDQEQWCGPERGTVTTVDFDGKVSSLLEAVEPQARIYVVDYRR